LLAEIQRSPLNLKSHTIVVDHEVMIYPTMQYDRISKKYYCSNTMQYEYEWDHNKARSNLRKHCIQFADAVETQNPTPPRSVA
jgi:hypothetical protein